MRIGGTPVAYVGIRGSWIGVMALGYSIGPYFAVANPARPRRLVQIGGLLTLAFLLLRSGNLYGEPVAWKPQADLIATLISFFNTSKYPPSLQFLLMTLGPALMLLGGFERLAGRVAEMLVTIGRVPFFFYASSLPDPFDASHRADTGFSLRQVAVLFIENPRGSASPRQRLPALGDHPAGLVPACCGSRVKARRDDWWIRYL